MQEIVQKSNKVLGDQAAGNIDKSTTNIEIESVENLVIPRPASTSPMSRMIAKYRAETEKDCEIKVMIDRLQRWHCRPVGDVIGLEEKLRNGGRPDIVDTAVAAKDRFSKILTKHEYSPAAQEIYAYLLAKIHQLFSMIIFPQICRCSKPEEINRLLVTDVYDRIEHLLEDNPLEITPEEVMGMLFWLTGNCHLKWKNDAHLQPSV